MKHLYRLPDLTRSSHNWLAQKLSRVTSTGDLIPEIDGLRFIAISMVVFHHLVSIYLPASGRAPEVRTFAEWMTAAEQSWIVLVAYCGHFGVNLFFVISGFILALPFAKRAFNELPAPNLKSYYLRRVTRIEPPYVICLVVSFLVYWHDKGNPMARIPNLVAGLFYSHGLVFGHENLLNGVMWSLEVEIQFYVLVPLLVHVFKLKNAALRRGLILAAILAFGWLSLWVIYPSGSARLRLTLFNFLHYFLMGFLLADLYLSYAARNVRKRFVWDVLTVSAVAAMLAVLLRFGQFYFLLPFPIGLLYLGCYLGRLSNAFVRLRWIVIIGGMCYTIYLCHTAIIAQSFIRSSGLTSLTRPFTLDFAIQCLVIVPALLIISSVLFVIAEKPFMRWSLTKRPPVAEAAVVSAD